MVRNMFVNILAMVAVVLFAATALAGEREFPRPDYEVSNGLFPPPHVEAGIELERMRQEKLPQIQEILTMFFLECQKRQNQEDVND